jgi:signal peptidase I
VVAERHPEKALPSVGPGDQPPSPDLSDPRTGSDQGVHDPTGPDPAGEGRTGRTAAPVPQLQEQNGSGAAGAGNPPGGNTRTARTDGTTDDLESTLGDESGPADPTASAETPSGAPVNPNTCDHREEPGVTSRERPSPLALRDRLRSPVKSTVPEGPLRSVIRVFSFLLTVALLLAGIRFFLVQTFVIPSGSMENTLQVGDRVIVSRWSYRFGEIQRGDVVVFDGEGVFSGPVEEPDSPLAAVGHGIAKALGMPVGETDYVKRVIGLPGDRVTCCDAHKRLMVNGKSMSEPYLYPGDSPSELRFDIVVPEGRLWVMGDHRSDSGDSREHMSDPSGGTVPVGQVVGRVVAVWWPLDRWSGMGRSGTLLESGGGQEGGS